MTHQHQLNLFPLHPENLFEERNNQDDNVAHFFNLDGGATLNGLLGGGGGGGYVLPSSDDNSSSPLQENGYGGQESDGEASLLARMALRRQERDAGEEKWVVYSEVVEKKKDKEVRRCDAGDLWYGNETQKRLSLKLDYEEIMNSWSDKSPLCMEGESPQTVPDVHEESLDNMLIDCEFRGNVKLRRVPNEGSSSAVEDGSCDGTKKGEREARVSRYKEKRQSRLFSNSIRYQVRKLNAEKRPRIKGRFVKRN